MNKKVQKKMIPYIVGCVIFLLLLVSYYLYSQSRNNYQYLKVNSKEHLVYTETQTENGHYYQYKPYLNIKGNIGTVINDDITQYISQYNQEDVCITYDYDVNGNVLSLVIKVEDYGYAESAIVLHFRSYNIHLKRLELLSDEELFSYYELDSNGVENLLNQKLLSYHQDLQAKGDISSQCNYDCFLESRNIDLGLGDTSFYIQEGKLVAYKPYTFIQTEASSEIVYGFTLTN